MEMDDKFLYEHRRDPARGFARGVREKLHVQEESRTAPVWRPLVAAAAALGVVAMLFMLPAVRAGAQAMLDMFRVRNFVAVSFDADRFEKLRSIERDNAMLLFDRKNVLQEPGRPVVHSSTSSAAAAVGFGVEVPTYLPDKLALDTVLVTGEGRVRLGVSTARLREMLVALDLRDVEVPSGLDGQDLEVHMHPVVSQSYRAGRGRLRLLQSRSPEVSLPTGVDLARVAEVGLRILGLDAGEARRIAANVDWRSTLLVPVPANAASFRSVTVQGNPGLLITTTGKANADGERRRSGSMVLWSEGDRVFALQGTLGSPELIQVAESVR